MQDNSARAQGGPIIFLMGPTGVGKTGAAITLAARLPLEIVSVDSALVYRGLDVGSAKPNPALRRDIPHHLIDICAPTERYSAARFRADALACINGIHARGKIALLVGGTGLYFRALEHGLAPLPPAEAVVRERLAEELREFGNLALHNRLAAVDPGAAARIHPNDPQRLIRALEVFQLTGAPMSQLWDAQQLDALPQPPLKLILLPTERPVLHARIARRFDDMLERGFINEVAGLRARGDLSLDNPALRAVGYRAIWHYLDGQVSFAEMREQGIAASRQLAKRQLTWLRRETQARGFVSDSASLSTDLLAAIAARDFQTFEI